MKKYNNAIIIYNHIMNDIIIIGGGISGLYCAYSILKRET